MLEYRRSFVKRKGAVLARPAREGAEVAGAIGKSARPRDKSLSGYSLLPGHPLLLVATGRNNGSMARGGWVRWRSWGKRVGLGRPQGGRVKCWAG